MATEHFQATQTKDIQVKSANIEAQEARQVTEMGDSQVMSVADGEDTLFFETFDNNAPGWMSLDQTDVGVMWHLDTYNAYGGSGESWWMADPAIGSSGGYASHWYQVMDTDEITLSGSPELTFFQRLNVEAPGGEPTGYDAWDGVNVRISTDGGTSWSVLTPTSPAYTATSLYSFGFEFGEGTGVPGWAGSISTWTESTFDLSAYTGESVMIRFAFCSDPGYDTNDNDALFGWQVDDIEVTDGSTVLYSNEGVATGVTPQNWAPVGGDYWHIANDVSAPSPTAIADANDEATGSYHTNMINEFISPYFHVPSDAEEVLLDFSLRGSFTDPDEFPNVDFWGARVQVQGESTWRYISNVTQDPNGNNFVYSDAPTEWFTFADAYNSGAKVDLTPLVGLADSLRVKFIFTSDADTPEGEAIQLDNIYVYSPGVARLIPTGLSAEAGDGQVDLAWDDLNEGSEQDFYYDDGTMESFLAGQPWETPVVGAGWAVQFETLGETQISTVQYMLSSGNTTYPGQLADIKIVIWDHTGAVLYESDAFTPNAMDELLVHDLTAENLTIDGVFYAGWTYTDLDYPYIALDSSSPSAGKAYAYHPDNGGSFLALSNYPSIDGNYAIRVTGNMGASGITYNVYRRLSSDAGFPGTPIALELAESAYIDMEVVNGTEYYYAVSSVYPDGGESELSEEVFAKPEAESIYEMGYDDGTAETGYSIGENGQFAVRITPEDYPVQVMRAKIYLNDSGGDAVLTLWDDDGDNGMPGTILLNTIWRNLEQGWNEKDIAAADINITAGDFFLGIKERSATPASGIDQSEDHGRSYYFVSDETGWDALANLGFAGNLMYRAMLDSSVFVGVGPDDATLPSEIQMAQNYPNPFNPVTTIKFNLPAEMNISLAVYDIHGQLVRELFSGSAEAGMHQVAFDGESIPSGMYIYKLTTNVGTITKKMILLK